MALWVSIDKKLFNKCFNKRTSHITFSENDMPFWGEDKGTLDDLLTEIHRCDEHFDQIIARIDVAKINLNNVLQACIAGMQEYSVGDVPFYVQEYFEIKFPKKVKR